MDFECVNADLMFALTNQICHEVEQVGQALVDMGVDQIAAYPLFRFPYTKRWGKILRRAITIYLQHLLKSDRLCAVTQCDNGLRLYHEPLDQSSQYL